MTGSNFRVVLFAFATFLGSSAVQADGVRMKVVPPPLNVQIIGGQPANPAAWPATVIFENLNSRCTATAVGDRVILTAAHCVGNGETALIEVDSQGGTIGLVCDHHPAYPADISADFALCLTSSPLNFQQRYEAINRDSSAVSVGKRVTLLGFGCRTVGGNDHAFGQLYEGEANISMAAQGDYVVTNGGGAVCYGDSGGASYSQDPISRRVIAINSRGDISQNSWLSVTATSRFLSWATSWRSQEGARICGIHPGVQNCHQ